jgi:hypothetical protein
MAVLQAHRRLPVTTLWVPRYDFGHGHRGSGVLCRSKGVFPGNGICNIMDQHGPPGGVGNMSKPYVVPKLVVYGRIADSTFTTPHGQVKGCKTNCHIDNFGEQSALSTAGS